MPTSRHTTSSSSSGVVHVTKYKRHCTAARLKALRPVVPCAPPRLTHQNQAQDQGDRQVHVMCGAVVEESSYAAHEELCSVLKTSAQTSILCLLGPMPKVLGSIHRRPEEYCSGLATRKGLRISDTLACIRNIIRPQSTRRTTGLSDAAT
ncbi:hypothetical protein EI94DRAFT_1696587 [Lactarius quietus]|nr:hypothetical protein EI94DRAFT_1696587 [Lactarius quietus]